MLRYYDSIDLVRPSQRREHSKYRYYSLEQLNTLSMIRYLSVDLKMPLEKIRKFMQSDGNSREKFIELLEQQKATLADKMEAIVATNKLLNQKIHLLKEQQKVALNTIELKEFSTRKCAFYTTDPIKTHEKIQENMFRMTSDLKPKAPAELCAFISTDMRDLNSPWEARGTAVISDEKHKFMKLSIPSGIYMVLPFTFSEENFEEALQALKSNVINGGYMVDNIFMLVIDYIDGAAAWNTEGYLLQLQILINADTG